MLTRRHLLGALTACWLAGALFATGGTPPAQAEACSEPSGVTVLVQFPDRHIETGCAAGHPVSGVDALTSAGFSLTYVTGVPFVCRIDGEPHKAGCSRTPPAQAFWAYFHSSRNGRWVYNTLGPASSAPAPGSVEGWRFGGGAAPTTAPSTTTSATASTVPQSGAPAVAAEREQHRSDRQHSRGAVSWIWGLVGLAVVGGAAGVTTFLRRRRGGSP